MTGHCRVTACTTASKVCLPPWKARSRRGTLQSGWVVEWWTGVSCVEGWVVEWWKCAVSEYWPRMPETHKLSEHLLCPCSQASSPFRSGTSVLFRPRRSTELSISAAPCPPPPPPLWTHFCLSAIVDKKTVCVIFTTHCVQLTTYYLLLTAFYVLLTAYYLLRTAYGLLLSTFYLLPTACCLLPTAYCLLPTAYCLLSTAYCLLSTVYCLLPTVYILLYCFTTTHQWN